MTRDAATPRQRGKGETILVVEDDEAVRRSSVEALREMGYEVMEAGDAMDGVRLIVDHGGIDLLFTDVGLPGGVNGRALADAARSAQPGVRVLFTTGYTHNAIMQEGMLDCGMYFIAKPFSLTALASEDPRGAGWLADQRGGREPVAGSTRHRPGMNAAWPAGAVRPWLNALTACRSSPAKGASPATLLRRLMHAS